MKNKVEVFFASDNNYLPYLSVALTSLSDHASDDFIYNVHILTTDFSDDSLKTTKELVKPNINVSVHNIKEKIDLIKRELAVRLRDYYSDSIYYRLFIPSLFPRLKRAVYLDSDIVLTDDVAKLYFTDLNGNLLGAVTDESVISVPVFCDYVKCQIGISNEREYFNSGVLVIDLDGFRREGIEEKFTYLLKTYNFDTVAPDQDYLNFLCRGKVEYLDCGWNKHAIEANVIPRSELHIMHFNMFNKPWHYSGVQNGDLFWYYAAKTPFLSTLIRNRFAYTDEERERDSAGAVKLIEAAQRISEGEVFMAHSLTSVASDN